MKQAPKKAQYKEEEEWKPEEEANFRVVCMLVLAKYALVLHDFKVQLCHSGYSDIPRYDRVKRDLDLPHLADDLQHSGRLCVQMDGATVERKSCATKKLRTGRACRAATIGTDDKNLIECGRESELALD